MRSLTVKLVLSFWFVSLIGITLGLLFARQISFREIGNLAESQGLEVQLARLETYYQTNGSWQGLELSPFHQGNSPPPPDSDWGIILSDPQGNILATDNKRFESVQLTSEQLKRGHKIEVDEEVVGILVFGPLREVPKPSVQTILRRISYDLLVGGLIASALSLLLGLLLARTFLQPIRALTQATQTVAQGNFETSVPVRTKDEIGTLAHSFNEMLDQLKQARDLRRQMTADIAHELRTPLSLLLGHTEAMSDGVLPPTPETLTIIHDEAQQLTRLVEDLRTLSLSETGELSLNLSATSPATLLRDISDRYRNLADQQNVSLQIDIAPSLPDINIDPDRVSQVLQNLLDNAFRYTPSGGQIIISVQASQSNVVFYIQDSGPGIKPDNLPYIFERFYRGDKARGRDGGAGLGLAIASSLMKLHQGEIQVESELGKGTTFTVTLPGIKSF